MAHKSLYSIGFVFGCLVLLLLGAPRNASAAGVKVFREGWLERYSGGSAQYAEPVSVEGWAYDNGKPVTVVAVLQNQSTAAIVTQSDTVYIARSDVDAVLKSKKRGYRPGPTGFKIIFPALSTGVYRLKSVTYNGRPFKVHQGVLSEVPVAIDHNLQLTSPIKGMVTTIARSGSLDIRWTDINANNTPTQSYTLYLTPVVPSKTCFLGWAYNTHTFTWKVGDFPSNGGGECTMSDVTAGEYKVQIVKQYAPGERTTDESGIINFVN